MKNTNLPSKKGYKNTQKEDIQNPINYFNTVVKNMNKKEFQKLKIVHKTEISIEFNDLDEQIILNHSNSGDIEDQLNNCDALLWIEFLENKKLYHAIKKLNVEDIILLHMWVNQKYTQKEIACYMNMEEKTVNKKLTRIRKHLKEKLEE